MPGFASYPGKKILAHHCGLATLRGNPPTRFPGLALLMLCFLLQSCTSMQKTAEPEQLTSPEYHPNRLNSWLIRGKLSVETGEGRHATGFTWEQDFESFDIQLNGFIGFGSAHLYGNNLLATLEASHFEQALKGNPDQLSEAVFGEPMPFGSLYWWIRGLENPELPVSLVTPSAPGRKSFRQQEWLLEFSDFRQTSGVRLPWRITARSPSASVKVIIKHWQSPFWEGE